MRATPIPPCPAALAEENSRGARERAKAIQYYARDPPPEKAYGFKVYRDDDVKIALNAAFLNKCAYCESSYAATAPVDVEHYRPKAEVVTRTGKTLRPGYYWLAATWTNLLPSCIECNRARYQRTPNGSMGLSGKANLFPLADERKRVRRPGSVESERPLLLHPCFDRPEEHLEFGHPDGVVRPAADPSAPWGESVRGRATCDVLGLNRVGLARQRDAHAKRVEIQLEHIVEAEDDVARHPGDDIYTRRLERELGRLAELHDVGAPDTMMTLQLIARHRAAH
jgi:hypothetical protein